MTTRLCLLTPDVALSLPAARVRLLRRTCDGLGGFDETNPLAVARAISFRELPERTVDLFHAAIYFGSDEGRQLIASVVGGRRDLAPWVLLSAIDLAIDIARASERGDEVARALQVRAQGGAPRVIASRAENVLSSASREGPEPIESIVECGRVIHGASFVEGWVRLCSDGVVRAIVIHGGPVPAAQRPSEPPERRARPDATEPRGMRGRRSLACDTVRWDAARGRVGLSLARASTLQEWRVRLGEIRGGEGFFERRSSRPPER